LTPERGKETKGRYDSFIPGFHGVRESLIHAPQWIEALWVAQDKRSKRAEEIIQLAEKSRIPVVYKKTAQLTSLFPHLAHQGLVAVARRFQHTDLTHLIEVAKLHKEKTLVIAADHITDEGNLGALIRTGAFFGAHGLILPKDRSAGVTPKVLKRASGAHLYLPIARVVNLGRALDQMKEAGIWVVGSAGKGPVDIYQFDWDRHLVLVMGSEQRGLSRSVLGRCDQVVRIPSPQAVESLNVSVACGTVLSEILRQRRWEREG
jgi:23S rRNA (guanosine2251-2'-O)-methyltransferase